MDNAWHADCVRCTHEDGYPDPYQDRTMDQYDLPAIDDADDPYAELREQPNLDVLREGRLDSTHIDVSRQEPPLSEDEFLEQSG